MKIAMFFDKMIWGGIERVGISYVQLFIDMGYSVDVYILGNEVESIVDELKSKCDVVQIPFLQKYCPDYYWNYAMDVDFFGLEKIYFGLMSNCMKIFRPFIRMKNNMKGRKYDLGIAFSGHINDLTYLADNYISVKHKIAWLHGTEYSYRLLSPGFACLYKKIKNLVCLSEFLDEECKSFNLKNRINKIKIYNPIILKKENVDKNKVKELTEKYGDFCMMVGRLDVDKDQDTVILAVKCLKENYNLNKKLLLLGDGVRRKELEQFVTNLGMEDDVVFVGNCSDIQNYYCAAHMLVHSSPFEGLPTVVLEALGYGVPVVATDSIAGVREILGDNKYGLISPIGKANELANNISKIYMNSSLREELIMKGKERIKDFYPETIKKQIEQYIDSIISE